MKRRAIKAAVLALALLLAGGAVLVLHPDCLILKYTGYFCAGCGTQHMVWALLRGDFSGALHENAFMLAFLPIAAVYVVVELARYIRGKKLLCQSKGFLPAACLTLACAAVFTVLRNLPGFQFLAPAWAAGA